MNSIHSALVVDTNRKENVLTQREFVWPIQRALPVPSKVVHISKLKEKMANDFDMVVFTGCTFKDVDYLKRAKSITWIKKTAKPVLGICAGQQLIALAFGGKVKALKQPLIGLEKITLNKKRKFLDTFPSQPNVYFLHQNEVSLPKGFVSLAKSRFSANEIILHSKKPIVGVSFHPEVLNKDLFRVFVKWAEEFG